MKRKRRETDQMDWQEKVSSNLNDVPHTPKHTLFISQKIKKINKNAH